ncbi:ABC transporter substrate-binding protein [Quisquiliibacterium transsilvanicum]|jgi:branched-chain amino acid transport system substrate-binding protein|uniref:Branched-chain amino acid transport system substrate-binding protein n=1 Tax=Quisquiliibacterium transsilvanicum TaxID=1549638 RepID=A0A7W8HGT8_9BURK|nr:ABC transporter substrate-binding protein [Quisquiliibacterium transsilvanicum]MBB5271653.1 branched-chain amino acid transport system substrate-binding protein [Quisquiliibacterium transsilvanicum]
MSETPEGLNDSRRNFGKAVAGVAAGTALSPAIVRAQTSKVKVGVLLPKSGYLAQLGQSCQRGADVAPEVLREMYGVDIELMNADFESNVDQARARAEKLINDGAQVLVGPFESGAAAAIAQVAEQRKVPFVVNIAAAPQITEQGYKYTFRNFPTSVELIRNGLGLFRDIFQATQTAPRTCILMHANDTFGLANRRAIDAIFPTLNYLPFKIVDSISYDPAARDLSVEVAKAKASGAEIVMMVCRLNDAILLVREMVKQRWSPQGLMSPGSPGMYEEPFYKALGKYSEYAISNVPWYNPKAKLTGIVEKAFDKRFPKDKMMFHALNVGFTFEAMMVVADAVKRSRSTDGTALAEAIRQTNISERMMLGGPIRFNAKGQNTEIASAAVQNRNLRPTVVLPKDTAELAPVFPVPDWSRRG